MGAAALPALNTPRATWPLFAVAAGLRLVRLNGPLVGVHSWRQADTAAIARHFAEGQMQWWLPQIDWAGASPGYVESEFPLYPYLLAWLYRLTGMHDWLARGLSLVFSLLTLWLLLRIGQRLLNPSAAWWGGLMWALVPLAVYYGRSVQAESLLLLLTAFCLERFMAWQEDERPLNLCIAWLSFTLCCLLKVLPLIWLGLPICWLWGQRRGWASLIRPLPIVLLLSSLGCTAAWYLHAHELGRISGLSFGFWASDTNRYSWSQLLGPTYWLGIFMRFSLRGMAVVGLPLLAIGITAAWTNNSVPLRRPWRTPGSALEHDPRARVLVLGLGSVLLAGALAPESSGVHEYYQLPLMLFACPLMGLGWEQLAVRWPTLAGRRICLSLLGLLVATSLVILSLDYWRVEWVQQRQLAPLAAAIQATTPPGARIVAVSGSDPTLLNLARRQGWLTKPAKVSPEAIRRWRREGSTALVGSLDTIESFRPFPDGEQKRELVSDLCRLQAQSSPGQTTPCPWPQHSWYVVPLAKGLPAPAAPSPPPHP